VILDCAGRSEAFTPEAELARLGEIGGVLVLESVSELPPFAQAELSRWLEGSLSSRQLKLIATSNTPLAEAVETGALRKDLCSRLRGATIAIPPLRLRRDEIPELFRFALRRSPQRTPGRVAPGVMERLCLHAWPFNVRELLFVARSAGLRAEGSEILEVSHLPADVRNPGAWRLHASIPTTRAHFESAPEVQRHSSKAQTPRVSSQDTPAPPTEPPTAHRELHQR
jgi:DNA-binding NtrC family response regulator